mmetsp:Transcript_33932/g.66795  ORF Transcript_33932/g.66795 Transcript_33932/m.66795 type:complete len:207 (-) Transcript_33932:1729-2349(-)
MFAINLFKSPRHCHSCAHHRWRGGGAKILDSGVVQRTLFNTSSSQRFLILDLERNHFPILSCQCHSPFVRRPHNPGSLQVHRQGRKRQRRQFVQLGALPLNAKQAAEKPRHSCIPSSECRGLLLSTVGHQQRTLRVEGDGRHARLMALQNAPLGGCAEVVDDDDGLVVLRPGSHGEALALFVEGHHGVVAHQDVQGLRRALEEAFA